MKRVRGQALSEMQAAMLLAGVLAVAASVAGAFWWYQQGQMNLAKDLARQFDDARTIAQGGSINVQITSSSNQTTVVLDTGTNPNSGRIIRTNQVQGTPTFKSSAQTWTGSITFIVQPDGYAQVYGYGACPSDLTLVIQSHPGYTMSCDPLSVSGA